MRVGWKWKGEGADKVSEGTLYIAAPSALATKITFQEAIIIGRVNRLFGLPENGRVTRMAVEHDRKATPPLKTRKKGHVAPDTEAALENVEDGVLREKLQKLAKSMAGDKAG